MPVLRRGVSYAEAYASQDLYANSDRKDALADASMAGMTGVLHQLGFLASYATEMFDGLFKVANATNDRLKNCSDRAINILHYLPHIEDQLENAPTEGPINFPLVGKLEVLKVEDPPREGWFNQGTMPDPIMARYNECDPVPNFASLDEHAGYSCTKKYSNPQFFREKWIQEEMERLEKLKEEKAERKKARKARKAAGQKNKVAGVSPTKQPIQVQGWRAKANAQLDHKSAHGETQRMDAGVVEKTGTPVQDQAGEPESAAYDQQAYDQQAYDQQAYDQQAYDQQAYDQQAYDQQYYDQQAYDQQAYDQQAYDSSAPALPDDPYAAGADAAAPALPDDPYSAPPALPQPGAEAAPPPLPTSQPMDQAPPPIPAASVAAPIPASPIAMPAMPKPPMPALGGGLLAGIQGGAHLKHVEKAPKLASLQDNLMNAIQGGKVLRKAAPVEKKAPDARGGLLSAIKGGGLKSTLRRVEIAQAPKIEAPKSEIADILARRMVIAAESESEEEDSDDDWD